MKYLYIMLLSLAVCIPSTLCAEKTATYLSEIEIDSLGVLKENREVRLSMQIGLSRLKMKTQHTVALIPVIISKDGSREMTFPPVVIDGRTRNSVYLRAQRLESVEMPPYHDDNAQAIIRRKNGKDQNYDYSASVPYERWMLDGKIEMREEVHGCVNCPKGESEQPFPGTYLPEYIPEYLLAAVEPEPEPVKVRVENRAARLQYRWDSYRILPDFKNNRTELDTVFNSIDLVKNNPDISITGIYITGYASPEGTVAYNLRLAKNRSNALADYICRENGIDRSLIYVDWKGEDWDGFAPAVETVPELLKRDEVLAIINACKGGQDAAEERLRRLEPAAIYRRLLAEAYPLLRRSDYRIEYNVRNFDLEEARRLINERPDLLSLSEMYKVAGSYEKGTAEYENAMRVAAVHYPDSPAVLNDRALDAIASKDYAEAVRLLEQFGATKDNAVLLNTLGVAYANAGELSEAEQAFLKAKEAGYGDAAHNLSQVQAVIDQQ